MLPNVLAAGHTTSGCNISSLAFSFRAPHDGCLARSAMIRYGLHWSPRFRQVRTGLRRHISCCESMESNCVKTRRHYAISAPSRADAITLQGR